MKAMDIIEDVRLQTFDYDPDHQTWSDDQYLQALNAARRFLYNNYPESRTTSVGELQAYADIESSGLGSTMAEDECYHGFLVNHVAAQFFGADNRDNRDAQRSKEFYGLAARSLGEGRSA